MGKAIITTTAERTFTRNVASGISKGRVIEIFRMRSRSDSRARRRLCCRGTPPRGCGMLRSKNPRRDRRRRRGCDKDTRGRAEAYNCHRTELDSKAATTHKDTVGRYYNNVQVSCRHLKGPHCFSRGTAIFGRSVRGKRYIYILLIEKEKWLSRRLLLPLRVFLIGERGSRREDEGGILQKMPSRVFYRRGRLSCILRYTI